MTPIRKLFAVAALACVCGTTQAAAYDNDEQALRVRDMVADPSVPLAWDRRAKPETWRYRFERDVPYCGKHRIWNGDACVRRHRH